MLVGIGMIWHGLDLAWPPLAWATCGVWLCGCAVASYWMEPKNDKREG